ncbi:uncharacterized protein UV8b_02095 [Ustilaginoidea virens]|uniref:Uncharacterized protein n=1 Tax=Ustilaginoidea virens TaxID=1159556 RepID=A0A8E5HLU5_USTVR|nr:uncharacterized protein UV8b_02095 [Ustilaginoidea virens]QUC17854.1 hypothetical protein UV8b_02095 [Ustilaginoidea virens]
MTINTAANGHGPRGHGSTTLPYRPQPGSPTLTNPDMILPDYGEPEPLDDRPHSSLAIWDDAQRSDPFDDFSQTGYIAGPLLPATPIIYGNGTMLSDIGEVTEVESNVSHPPSQNPSQLSGSGRGSGSGSGIGTPSRTSPITGERTLRKRWLAIKRERRLSIDSTSTAQTTDGTDRLFGELDDSVSVDDSNFQGDDEESLASEFVDEMPAQNSGAAVVPAGPGLNVDAFSTNSISMRAEQILANAKRRLTTMEGNLNRARTFSYCSASNGSTPSPGYGSDASMTERTKTIPPNHSRNVSENSLYGATRAAALPQRSASALGAADGYRQPLTLSRSADVLVPRSSLGSLRSPLHSIESTLETLDEDEGSQVDSYSPPSSRFQNTAYGQQFADAGQARSASAAQMRDLHDQMEGLKGKISTLKEKAKQDSMKRRSLQSLRALSPFTYSQWDQGYAGCKSSIPPEDGSLGLAAPLNGTVHGLDNGEPTTKTQVQSQPLDREAQDCTPQGIYDDCIHQDELLQSLEEGDVLGADSKDDKVDNVDQADQVGFDDDISESGESLYHDSQQEPTDISHEDREDAFDYEHFFLHSAMGTLSRQRMSRSGSFSSEESDASVETTRGPAILHGRRPSIDTMTSVNTFATAREVMESRSSTSQSFRVHGDGFATVDPEYEDVTLSAAGGDKSGGSGHGGGGGGGCSPESHQEHARHGSVVYRPAVSHKDAPHHRPSVSSFESTGTNRSFPLVNKTTSLSGGTSGPSGSPDNQSKQVAESLMNETASICDRDAPGSGPSSPAMQTLSREDQVLVEQVVASLGKCVLGLSEATRRGTGNHEYYRHRIEAAKRLLENIPDRIL